MKASLSEYITALSGNKLSILEEVISKKYRKFTNFFKLVKDYSESIVKLKYNFTNDSTLDIELTMKTQVEDISEELKEEMFALGYDVESEVSGKKMKLVIVYDESTMN